MSLPDSVSRETREALEAYVALLLKWNAKINLIGRATEDEVWRRHIIDAIQLRHIQPQRPKWVDFGSGAGIPGIPLALALHDMFPDPHVQLIEADQRKAVFLREAVRVTGAPATVHRARIEDVEPLDGHGVTARALAPLHALLNYAEPWLARGGHARFLKGRGVESELTRARRCWTFHVKQTPSVSDPDGVILDISEVRRIDVDRP